VIVRAIRAYSCDVKAKPLNLKGENDKIGPAG